MLLRQYRSFTAKPLTGSGRPDIIVRRLGLQDYGPLYQAMRYRAQHPREGRADEIWLLSHKPVFTQGQAGKAEHLLNPGAIPVVQSDRGGQVTYHGPGQLVVYLLLTIKHHGLGARGLVDLIENSVIGTLAEYGIQSASRRGAPGVYVGDAKIAALGLRIRRGQSYHGLSLNVNMDLEPFSRINPCGFEELTVTQVADQLPADSGEPREGLLQRISRGLTARLLGELGYALPGGESAEQENPAAMTAADKLSGAAR